MKQEIRNCINNRIRCIPAPNSQLSETFRVKENFQESSLNFLTKTHMRNVVLESAVKSNQLSLKRETSKPSAIYQNTKWTKLLNKREMFRLVNLNQNKSRYLGKVSEFFQKQLGRVKSHDGQSGWVNCLAHRLENLILY